MSAGAAGAAVGLALVRPAGRAVPWRAIAAAGCLGLVLAGTSRLMGDRTNEWQAVNVLRISALAFATGLAFLLDDPARHTTAAVPTRRAVRQLLRAALVAPVAALWWTAALLLVPSDVRPPAAGIALEAAAACALALAGAALAVRRGDSTRPGRSVAGALLTSAVLAVLLWPDRWELFVAPGAPDWAAAHERWAVLLGTALAVWAACGAEPVRRRPRGCPPRVRRPG